MKQDRLAWILCTAVSAETHRKVERDAAVKRHGRGNIEDLEVDPRLPVANEHIGVNQRRLDVLRERPPLCARQIRGDVRDHHMITRKYNVLRLDPLRHAGANIAHEHAVARLADIDAGRIETDAGALAGATGV